MLAHATRTSVCYVRAYNIQENGLCKPSAMPFHMDMYKRITFIFINLSIYTFKKRHLFGGFWQTLLRFGIIWAKEREGIKISLFQTLISAEFFDLIVCVYVTFVSFCTWNIFFLHLFCWCSGFRFWHFMMRSSPLCYHMKISSYKKKHGRITSGSKLPVLDVNESFWVSVSSCEWGCVCVCVRLILLPFFGSFTYQQTNKNENHWHSSICDHSKWQHHLMIFTTAIPHHISSNFILRFSALFSPVFNRHFNNG